MVAQNREEYDDRIHTRLLSSRFLQTAALAHLDKYELWSTAFFVRL
jgi:hypothetical protein